MTALEKSIGILGGSFDPVHNGHLSIAQSFLDSDLIDQLWVLLAPDPPHKTGRTQTNYQLRFEMLQAAFKNFNGVKVSDLEKKLPQPSFTIQTLEYLEENYPEYTFRLCIGGDSLRDFKKWKDWQKILDHANLLVARRPSADIKNIDENIKNHLHFIDHEPVQISSTKIRDAVANGDDISGLVPSSVNKIIDNENLYRLKV
ncbi:nicotinate (nicotinamide) nucleotide adenylyltransferase [Aliifodinibius salipaludis]|uniref:Probable nicotinate-nucleotide adenylyltransferase n=1 Tax=Fodinibius salipaludis TaxID=2032627 RepID=A0A2A2GAC8_9BACT|nr:nicotinate (nicotinamide) nucleotide adenylyltransferase [Aliifodinibius salipaludis]PAU93795.1 nicotinate (nicotinamide) nucleotide adenylyltransferase [Aliifodinibius salipaludis]